MNKKIEKFDEKAIMWMREYGDELARISLFIIFFWFGILKVLALSPAEPLVISLAEKTLFGIDPVIFNRYFGGFEALLGILLLFPRLQRITFIVIIGHLITTVLPLFVLPELTWHAPFVPTLTGQYIIKNLALLSLVVFLMAEMKPMTKTHSFLAEEE